MKAFTKVAPYYEQLMASVPYRMWLGFLQLIWTKLEVEPQEILEVACGTGKMCRMLAKDGYNVVGVDVSQEMVEEARRLACNARLDIEYFVQDAAELELPHRFDAAFSFFDSLNNIVELDRFREAIRRIRLHLKPGAPFLFDVNTAYAFEHKMFDQSSMKPSDKLRYRWVSSWDSDSALCTIEMDFWNRSEHFHETHIQRAYTEEEIRQAMRDAGFARVQLYNAYSLEPPRKNSDRIHILGIA